MVRIFEVFSRSTFSLESNDHEQGREKLVFTYFYLFLPNTVKIQNSAFSYILKPILTISEKSNLFSEKLQHS